MKAVIRSRLCVFLGPDRLLVQVGHARVMCLTSGRPRAAVHESEAYLPYILCRAPNASAPGVPCLTGDSDDVEESGSDAEPAEPGSAAATLDESQDDSPADGGSDSGDDAGDGHPSPEDDSSADEDDSSAGEDDDGGEVDQRRLLLYERSKLRWYYAVDEFGSVEAAAHIYDNCDGMEFLKSE